MDFLKQLLVIWIQSESDKDYVICCWQLLTVSVPMVNRNSILWLHVIMAIVYLAVAGLFMVHYSLRLGRSQNFFVRSDDNKNFLIFPTPSV